MYTADALLDIHARAHGPLAGLLEYCATLEAGLATQPLPEGFGYPTILRQGYHLMASERYWFAVLTEQHELVANADDDADQVDYPDIPALQAWRERRAPESADWIRAQSTEALNTPRPLLTWGGETRELVPAQVVMRVCTHHFHHMGQIVAMCRTLGHPVPHQVGFPLT